MPSSDQFKFYSGDCYILQYNYPGEQNEEVFIGTWFGKNSIEVLQVYNVIHDQFCLNILLFMFLV